MTVVLDSYTIPEKGEFEIYVKRQVNLQVTAAEARQTVHSWLLHQVSYMMGAESPELVVNSEAIIWRVPVSLTASHVGRIGIVGHVDVDIETGEINHPAACKANVLHCAQALAAKLAPYYPRTEMPTDYTPVTPPVNRKAGRPDGNPLHLLPSTTRSIAL